jgi:hypothetical protein
MRRSTFRYRGRDAVRGRCGHHEDRKPGDIRQHHRNRDLPQIADFRAAQMQELAGSLNGVSGPVLLMVTSHAGSLMRQVSPALIRRCVGVRRSGPLPCCHTTNLQSGTFSKRIDYVMVPGGFRPGTKARGRWPGEGVRES